MKIVWFLNSNWGQSISTLEVFTVLQREDRHAQIIYKRLSGLFHIGTNIIPPFKVYCNGLATNNMFILSHERIFTFYSMYYFLQSVLIFGEVGMRYVVWNLISFLLNVDNGNCILSQEAHMLPTSQKLKSPW